MSDAEKKEFEGVEVSKIGQHEKMKAILFQSILQTCLINKFREWKDA